MKSDGFFKKFGVCALSAALCVSAFSACGKTDGKGDKIDGNTDIATVKSEQVKDEAAWKAAFDVSKFTNFSMKEEEKSTQAGVTQEGRLVYKFVGDKAYYSTYQKKSADENEQHDVFFAKTNEVWAAYGINYKNGAQISESAYDMENHSEFEHIVSGEMGIAPVSQLAQTIAFDKVTYDETAKGYLYEVEGQGTATIKIADGLFAGYIMKNESGEGDEKVVMEMKVSYYDIGSTSVSLPEKMGKPAEDKKDEDKKDDDKKLGVVLTADTDFEALKSEKVDEAGWKKAFDYASYKNFTSYTAYRTTNSYAVQKATEAGGFLKIGSYELYCYIGADGAYKMSDGKTEKTCASVFIRNDIPITMNYSCMCPDFSNYFWNFSYNESRGVYEYKGGLKTNAYFAEGNYSTYSSVRLKIVNGLLAYIDVEDNGEPDNRKTTKFYDFGTTVVELPEIKKDDEKKPGMVLTADTNFEALESEKVDAAGWAKAFNPASYNNFTALAYYDSIKSCVVQKSTGTSGFFGLKDTTENDLYLYKNADGKYIYNMNGTETDMSDMGTYFMRDGMPVLLNYSCMCPNFAKFFAEFTYDETKKSYVYAGKGIRTNDYFLTGGDYADYVKVELKIVNGLVAYVSVEDSSGNKENTKFYDFGTTAITLPAIGK